MVASTRHKVPECPALLAQKVTGDGENGVRLSDPPAEGVAALQEIPETPGVVVHLQVRGARVCASRWLAGGEEKKQKTEWRRL